MTTGGVRRLRKNYKFHIISFKVHAKTEDQHARYNFDFSLTTLNNIPGRTIFSFCEKHYASYSGLHSTLFLFPQYNHKVCVSRPWNAQPNLPPAPNKRWNNFFFVSLNGMTHILLPSCRFRTTECGTRLRYYLHCVRHQNCYQIK